MKRKLILGIAAIAVALGGAAVAYKKYGYLLYVVAGDEVEAQDGRPRFSEVTANDKIVAENSGGVPRDAGLGVGIIPKSVDDAIDLGSVTEDTVKLIRTRDGALIAGSVNTTAGGDSISFTPREELEADTGYRLEISGVLNQAGKTFVPISRSFSTGQVSADETPVNFTRKTVAKGIGSTTSLLISPDHTQLYASTLNGDIHRFDIDAATGDLSNQQTFSGLAGDGEYPLALVGIAFDPENDRRIWVTFGDNIVDQPAKDFTGGLAYIDLADGPGFDATVTRYVYGLPRSVRDHLTNSLAFGPDGMIYVSQGSNSAMGHPDDPWGQRPERLLSATVLKIDPSRTPPEGGFDVQTEDYEGRPGAYDPTAPDAVVTVFARGLRNAYDLVWHSNGRLYSPGNGSAAGGNSPDDPSTPQDEGLRGAPTQKDVLYDVVEGGYYGHPNPLAGQYILNGGNPTEGVDHGEVVDTFWYKGYPVGVQPDPDYKGYAYWYGDKRSPNGAIEYLSGAFDGLLRNTLMTVEFSAGDRIVGLRFAPDGSVAQNFVVARGFDNPLDLIEHQPSGRIYVTEFGAHTDPDDDVITLLTPLARELGAVQSDTRHAQIAD